MLPPMRALLLSTTGLGLTGCGKGLVLLEVDPGSVAAGGTIDVVGAGFDEGLAVSLEGAAGTVALAVVVDPGPDGANHASATLPASTPAGDYDVVVRGAAGEDRLPGALTVVAGQLEFFFIDVGQGDGTLVRFPDGATLLIDGGPRDAGAAVQGVIDDVAGGHLDAVAVTHTDADHLGGVVHVLRGDDGRAGSDDDVVPALRWFGEDDGLCASQLCDEFRGLRGAPFDIPALGDVIDHGGATATVVARDGAVAGAGPFGGIDEDNERSLALLFEFAGKSVFVGGDLTGGGLGTVDLEAAVAAVTGPVDVLHQNHHGSQTSSSPGFLDALQPRAVILSEGTDNAFCHPEKGVVDRLRERGLAVFSTGDGIVDAVDRCERTDWPAGARHGLGTFSVVVTADGAITIAGDSL
jgi:beta-lactamase superfamily II metal-dependent hydrolase